MKSEKEKKRTKLKFSFSFIILLNISQRVRSQTKVSSPLPFHQFPSQQIFGQRIRKSLKQEIEMERRLNEYKVVNIFNLCFQIYFQIFPLALVSQAVFWLSSQWKKFSPVLSATSSVPQGRGNIQKNLPCEQRSNPAEFGAPSQVALGWA